MNKNDNKNKNAKSSMKVLKDGVMELDDDIVSSVVGGMAEEYAEIEKDILQEKLHERKFI